MDELTQLIRLCPPPYNSDKAIALPAQQRRLGIPADYAELLEVYGPGCFDEFLWIYGEGAENIYCDLGFQTAKMREILSNKKNPRFHQVLEQNGVAAGDVIQWAGTDNADSFLWLPAGPSAQWKTLAVEAGALSFYLLEKSATTILLELMSGSLILEYLPDDFPSEGAGFNSSSV